jgi:hypothetical protein
MADQVSRLYELIAGHHATNLLEVARKLGVWEALSRHPGLTAEELAAQLGTQPFYTDVLCRTVFSMAVGGDDANYARHFRAGTTRPYQQHDEAFMREVAAALKALPRIFPDLVLPRLPALGARLQEGARVLDVGCGGGWAVVQLAEWTASGTTGPTTWSPASWWCTRSPRR